MSRSMGRLARLAALALPLLLAAACTGSIEGGGSNPGGGRPDPASPGNSGSNTGNPGNSPGGGQPGGKPSGNEPGGGSPGGGEPGDPGAPPSAQVACGNQKDTFGRRTLRRLTNAELERTVRAAFGLDTKQWVGPTLPPDPGSEDGFTNHVDRLVVSPEYARGAQEMGRKVAGVVSADPLLAQLLPCSSTGGRACAETFIKGFGAKLYRRPLTDAEVARYLGLFDKAKPTEFRSFVYWATSTLLQSPHVIYRTELGEPAGQGRFALTAHEVASELAYALTGGPPTDELLQLAASNRLSTADQVEAAARALIVDPATQAVRPAFREVLLRFTDQWLGLAALSNLKKDDMAFPDFGPEIQESLAEESRRFISAVLLEQKGTVADLLTAPYTFLDARLAKFYGYGAAPATGFARVDRPASWGVGLLAQGGMLALEAHSLHTSPTKRGYLVRTGLMCGVVPPPPPLVSELPEPTEAETTRKRYEQLHVADPSCKSCHQMMDPIGFAFEHLDATGRYRAKEGAYDIDDSGVLTATSKGDLPFRGPTELARSLASLPEVSDCVAANLAAYLVGLGPQAASCLVSSAAADLRAGMNLVDFVVKVARSDHFRLRQ